MQSGGAKEPARDHGDRGDDLSPVGVVDAIAGATAQLGLSLAIARAVAADRRASVVDDDELPSARAGSAPTSPARPAPGAAAPGPATPLRIAAGVPAPAPPSPTPRLPVMVPVVTLDSARGPPSVPSAGGAGVRVINVDVASPDAFQRVVLTGVNLPNEESVAACAQLRRALELRQKHAYVKPAYYYGVYDPAAAGDVGVADAGPAGGGGGGGGGTRDATAAPLASAGPSSSKLHQLFYRRRLEPPFRPFEAPVPPRMAGGVSWRWADGVAHVTDGAAAGGPAGSGAPPSLFPVPTFAQFVDDYQELCRIVHAAPVRTFAFKRLGLLEARFHLHTQLNAEREVAESKANPHRDFYNVRKVDTHVHHSAAMNQKHLLRFIKSKLRKEPDTVVIVRDGHPLTLAQVFDSLGLTAYDLSIDTLDMHAEQATFQRFDRFNLKYSPLGQSRLREVFLKTDNLLDGRFLAELTRELFDDLATTKYQFAEWRLSIYGRAPGEWAKLSRWVVDNRLACPQVRWMIQIPRLYEAHRASGAIGSFHDMLDRIFAPLFDVTLDPSVDPPLHQFLALVVGFDTVDDESLPEAHRDSGSLPAPAQWTDATAPPYHMWTYYIATNLAVLNRLRAARGLTQFSFRPHAGEAGDADHLAAAFLTAESVNHGILLKKSPPLQYLFYLAQIGLAMSPLSNNRLFLEYNKSPFYEFFVKGLNVSLSTDDPLMLALTREALIEEYAVAAQVWKLMSVDLCELARHSVLQSGYEAPFKAHYIGATYAEAGPAGNDILMTNVPYIRLQYRMETLHAELALVRGEVRGPAQADT